MILKFHPAINHDGTSAPYLIDVVFQHWKSDEVLFKSTMDRAACHMTQSSKLVHVYSRTDKKTRRKGDTSGDYLEVVEIFANCNWDCLLIKVRPLGKDEGACHTVGADGKKRPSCFFNSVSVHF